ncbi:MAG: hypothetical protein JO303_01120, partial [Caulobacteraceae bacterium]|nr:hypothetical protein [Caulobacteraceae bacterium]
MKAPPNDVKTAPGKTAAKSKKPRGAAAAAPAGEIVSELDPAVIEALASGRFADPFAVLGPHQTPRGRIVRAFLPGATGVRVIDRSGARLIAELQPAGAEGLFCGLAPGDEPYLLQIDWSGVAQETEDPYSFGLVLGDLDLHLFAEGAHWRLAERLGAAPMTMDGVAGVRFSVWVPNARRVSVVGDFNSWDGRRHPMRLRPQAGVWELFVPRLGAGALYKFEIVGPDGTQLPLKADPLARRTERPPATGSVVAALPDFHWTDADWMAQRPARQRPNAAISIYEVHAGSWLRPEGHPQGVLDWTALTERLIPYVAQLGFTHI